MGHYDDLREAAEAAELKVRAKKAGRTPDQQREHEYHEWKMAKGKKIHEDWQKRQDLMNYYLEHKDE